MSTSPKAEQIEFIPSGGLSATNLQAALNELDSEATRTANLAAPSGSSLIGYDTGTVQDVLDAVTGPTGAASVGYTPAGVGAVATTVQEKLRKTSVHLFEFGAFPSATAAVNTAAINAAFASGAKLVVGEPGAVYAVDGQISISSALEFDGQGCTFSATLGAGVRLLQVTAAASIKNLTLDFNDGYALNAINFPTANVGYFELVNVIVRDIYDLDTTSLMIVVNANADRNEIRFDGLTLKNIKKRSDGDVNTIGGGIEGIHIFAGTSGAVGGGGYIRNISIENLRTVNSSDVDVEEICNAIYFAYAGATDRRTRITVENVKAFNYGRRLFKTQCDDLTINDVYAEVTAAPALVCLGLQDYDTSAAYNVKVKNAIIRGKIRFAVAAYVTDCVLDGIDCNVSLSGITNPYGQFAYGVGIGADSISVTNSKITADIGITTNLRDAASYANPLKCIQVNDTVLKQRVANGYSIFVQENTSGIVLDSISLDNVVIDNTLYAASINIGAAGATNGTLNINNVTVIDNDANANGGSGLYVEGFSNVNISGYVHVNKSAAGSVFRTMRLNGCNSVQLNNVSLIAKPVSISIAVSGAAYLTASNIYVNPLTSYSLYLTTTASSRFSALRRDKVLLVDATSLSGALFAPEFSTGTTTQRPTTGLLAGQQYWDTTLSKPIWWNGSVWKDAAGTTV